MADPSEGEEQAGGGPGAITVAPAGGKWIVDYGGGVTRIFSSRAEAVAVARDAAAIEERDLQIEH